MSNEQNCRSCQEAYDYLSRMMLHRYPDVKLLPDLMGLVIQIDNGFGGGLRVTEERNVELAGKCAALELENAELRGM